MIQSLDHVAIAVENLSKSIEIWTELFGLHPMRTEEVNEQGVRIARLDAEAGPSIELISPLGSDSPIRRFLHKRGEGLHHICFKVPDIAAAIRDLREKGVEFVEENPRPGAEGSRVAFIHPRSLNGILVELKQG